VIGGKQEVRKAVPFRGNIERTICHLLQQNELFKEDLTTLIREDRTMFDFNAKRLRGVLRLRQDEFVEWLEKN
jgi:hypothetical protein